VRRHRLVQRNGSCAFYHLYPYDLVKKGPDLFPELEFDRSCPGGSSSLPTIDPDLFSFVLGITKPSLAFVNYTKAEHPTMERPPYP
jgi:hypothetical protein